MNGYLYIFNKLVGQAFCDSYCKYCDEQVVQAHKDLCLAPPEPMWTDHSGARIPVKTISDAHLFYAIAKAFRGEYPDSKTWADGVAALKREALSRLQSDHEYAMARAL